MLLRCVRHIQGVLEVDLWTGGKGSHKKIILLELKLKRLHKRPCVGVTNVGEG